MIAACQALHLIHSCVQAETGEEDTALNEVLGPASAFSPTLGVKKRHLSSGVFQFQELGAEKSSAPAGTRAAASMAEEALPCSGGYGPTVMLRNIYIYFFFYFVSLKRVSESFFLCSHYCHVKCLHKKKSG